MNNDDEVQTNNKIAGLLGVATSQLQPMDECPMDEQVAYLIENKLQDPSRQTILSHINRCSSCYETWLAATDCLDEQSAVPENALEPVVLPKSTQADHRWWIQFRTLFLNPRPIAWRTWGPVTATALIVMALILPPKTIDINTRITETYQLSIAHNAQLLTIQAGSLSLPWENTSLGFAGSNGSALEKAFGAGLWQGRAKLLNTDDALPRQLLPPTSVDWLSSSEADYYVLGRWAVLNWALSRTHGIEPDWSSQQQTLATLQEKWSKRPQSDEANQIAVASLQELQVILTRLGQSNTLVDRDKLGHTLMSVMHRLGPNNL